MAIFIFLLLKDENSFYFSNLAGCQKPLNYRETTGLKMEKFQSYDPTACSEGFCYNWSYIGVITGVV